MKAKLCVGTLESPAGTDCTYAWDVLPVAGLEAESVLCTQICEESSLLSILLLTGIHSGCTWAGVIEAWQATPRKLSAYMRSMSSVACPSGQSLRKPVLLL